MGESVDRKTTGCALEKPAFIEEWGDKSHCWENKTNKQIKHKMSCFKFSTSNANLVGVNGKMNAARYRATLAENLVDAADWDGGLPSSTTHPKHPATSTMVYVIAHSFYKGYFTKYLIFLLMFIWKIFKGMYYFHFHIKYQ